VKGRSCLTNLIEFFKEVKMIDEGRAADTVYIDFSKAVDKVPRGRLAQKVKSHGIRGELAERLAHSRERVAVEECVSE